MSLDESTIRLLFTKLEMARKNYPSPGILRKRVREIIPRSYKGAHDVECDIEAAVLFVSAAIEMWHRALHSFIVSVGNTYISPIWSSVSGYYASHYTIRAFGHLFGTFCIKNPATILQLSFHRGKFSFSRISGNAQEHRVYWRRTADAFRGNPLFDSRNGRDVSEASSDPGENVDSEHRHAVNYWDHINRFEKPRLPLEESFIRDQAKRISEFQPKTPQFRERPDIISVQTSAIWRITYFRDYIDRVVGGKNKYWNEQRRPNWSANLVTYPRPEDTLALKSDQGLLDVRQS